MKLIDELRECLHEIEAIENELKHPWSRSDKAFLEEELQRWERYRRKIELKLITAAEDKKGA